MNQAEGEAGNKAIDSLINYETVKVGIQGFMQQVIASNNMQWKKNQIKEYY